MLLVPAVLLFALLTEPGSRNLLGAVGHFAPLEIEYGSGTLAGRLNLKRIIYQTDGLRVELDDVVAELAPTCLWRSTLCFRQLRIEQLDIALLPDTAQVQSAQDSSGQELDAGLFKFPVPLESNFLLIQSMRVHWQDGEWAQGAAQLQVRVSGSTIDVLDAELMAPRLELRGSAGDALATDILVLPRINLPLELNVAALRLDQPSWRFYGKDYQTQSIALQGEWMNTRLQLAGLQLNSSDFGQLALQGMLDFTGDWPLQANIQASVARASPWPHLQGRALSVSASGTLAILELGLTAQGEPGLVAAGTVNVLDRLLPFTATMTATSPDNLLFADLVDLPDSLADLQLEFPVIASGAGNLDAQHLELQAVASGLGYPSLQLSLSGRHEHGLIVLDELAARDPSGVNDLRGNGEILLAQQVQWSLSLESNGMALPGLSEHTFGRLSGKLQLHGRARDEDWQVQIDDVDLHGEINNLPARISGFAGVAAGLRVSHSELEAELNGAQLTLRSSGDETEPVRLDVSIDQLARWLPDSSGQATFQVELAPNTQHVLFSGAVKDIAWQGLEIGDGAIAGDYQAQAGEAFKLDTRFTDVMASGIELSSLQLTVTGAASQHTLSLTSQGDVSGQLELAGALQEQQWTGILAPTTLHTPHGQWQLIDAVAMAWSNRDQQLAVGGHCWTQQRTQICPGDLLLGPQGSGSLEITGDMALLAGLFPSGLELDGDIQFDLEGSWSPGGGIIAQGESHTRDLLLTQHYGEGESVSIGWDRGDVVLNYDSSGLNLDWEAQRQGRKVLGLTLLLPPDRNAPLSGAASFEQLQLAALAPFVPSFSRLEGQINGQLQLSGTVDQPLAHGSLALSDGRLAMVSNPTELDALVLTVDVQGDWAEVRGSGKLGGGELLLAGQLKTQPELRLELAIDGNKHNILYPPSSAAVVSEKLKVVASQGLLDISGEFTVHEGLLEFEQLPEGSVAVSADVVEVDYAGNVIREELPFDISMDVRVAIQNRFKVAGSLLQTTLGGELHLLQRPGRPLRLFGNLNTVGGELRAYQQRLQIKRGIISFTGPPGNPLLDVRAQRNISSSGVTVGVQVRGPLEEDLTLEVYSDPAMSQGEAMSYLVRGRGLDAGAGADGTAMALSVAGGVVNRSTIVSELNRIPGVSNVEFGAEGSEDDTAATVSGYVGGRIYLSYGFGLYEPINVMTARLYLRPRLWLEVVSRLENSVDLYYSFDIK
jgi:autotransporter translocation and assembly factor TamB